MINVAILTLTGEYNYGNKLQNYAVQRILEKEGCSVETIRVTDKSYYKPLIKAYIQAPFLKYVSEKRKNRIKRRIAFCKFNKYIKQSYRGIDFTCGRKKLEERLKDYQYIFYGSDQIWNPEFPTFSDIYLGVYAPFRKNIAISASFGIENIDERHREQFERCLHNFKAISVREKRGAELVEKFAGINAEILVDPTMSILAEEWKRVERSVQSPKNYVLVYFLGNMREDILKTIAKQYKSEIVIANSTAGIGPSEFIYLIHHAKAVCTDSFHACVFSFLYEKNLYIFSRNDRYSSMNSRIETLLEKTRVKYFKNPEYIFISNEHIADRDVKKSIEYERQKMHVFISNAIEAKVKGEL